MRFILTPEGFQYESEDIVGVDEIVRDAMTAGFTVEVKEESNTVYRMFEDKVKVKTTVITIKP